MSRLILLFSVLEYVEYGSLRDFFNSKKASVSVQEQLSILGDVANGLRFLHRADPPIVHGNLKGTNVLIGSDLKAKLTDFGLAGTLGRNELAPTASFWFAPECLVENPVFTTYSDIYSFGVLIYEVFARTDPYAGENKKEVLREIVDPEINKRPAIPKGCPVKVALLMSDCFSADPQSRPSCDEVSGRVMRLASEIQTNPTAELHMETTIVCMDIAGFTSWASARNPAQSILLLEAGEFARVFSIQLNHVSP